MMRPSGVPWPTSSSSLIAPSASPNSRCSALHGHGDGAAGLDGVHADVVAQPGQLGDGVQVVDAAVGAEGPDGLVLHAGDDLAAVGVADGVGALDDAARAAGVVVDLLAQARLVALEDRLAGDLGGALEAPARRSCGWAGRRPRS